MDAMMPPRLWQLVLLCSLVLMGCGVAVGVYRGWAAPGPIFLAGAGVLGVLKSAGGRYRWWRRVERGTPRQVPLFEIVHEEWKLPGLSWKRELTLLKAAAAEASQRRSGSPRMLLNLSVGTFEPTRVWYSRRTNCWAVYMSVGIDGPDPAPLRRAVAQAYELVASRPSKGGDVAPLAAACEEVVNAEDNTFDDFEAALTALETALLVIDTDPRLASPATDPSPADRGGGEHANEAGRPVTRMGENGCDER